MVCEICVCNVVCYCVCGEECVRYVCTVSSVVCMKDVCRVCLGHVCDVEHALYRCVSWDVCMESGV